MLHNCYLSLRYVWRRLTLPKHLSPAHSPFTQCDICCHDGGMTHQL